MSLRLLVVLVAVVLELGQTRRFELPAQVFQSRHLELLLLTVLDAIVLLKQLFRAIGPPVVIDAIF